MDKQIYLDNAATTQTDPKVVEAMLPYFTEKYGNPSSIYRMAGDASSALCEARNVIAKTLGARADEIYFTGGGSESDNWAIKGTAISNIKKGRHIITTKIEHHAVLHTCEFLEKQGFEVTYLDVDEHGFVRMDDLRAAIRPDTILISIMMANNEIGTIEPVREIGAIAKEHGIPFHTDAVQAYGHVPIDVQQDNIDMLSASAHKFHGPKGVGFLYIRKGLRPENLIHGGGQEKGRRAGTENVPGIVGMAKAAQMAFAKMDENIATQTRLRDHLISRVLKEFEHVRLNGPMAGRLPNNANFSFRFIEGEALLLMLDNKGICASSGSACTSGSLDPSHVLLSIGLPHEIAHGSLRLTLSEANTMEEMDYVVEALKDVVKRLRDMSPLYDDFIKQSV